jgi:hypothetical protein
MKIVANVQRILLGLIFVVYGMNGLVRFGHAPSVDTAAAREFMAVMQTTPYAHVLFMPVLQTRTPSKVGYTLATIKPLPFGCSLVALIYLRCRCGSSIQAGYSCVIIGARLRFA